jgi:hypothetical protein
MIMRKLKKELSPEHRKEPIRGIRVLHEESRFRENDWHAHPFGTRWIAVGPKGQDLGLALAQAGWPDAAGLGKKYNAGGAQTGNSTVC